MSGGEGQRVAAPEVDPEDLVAGEDVGGHQRRVVDADAQPLLAVVALEQRRLEASAIWLDALHGADGEVGLRALQGLDHGAPGVGGQEVVGVDERHQVAGAVYSTATLRARGTPRRSPGR